MASIAQIGRENETGFGSLTRFGDLESALLLPRPGRRTHRGCADEGGSFLLQFRIQDTRYPWFATGCRQLRTRAGQGLCHFSKGPGRRAMHHAGRPSRPVRSDARLERALSLGCRTQKHIRTVSIRSPLGGNTDGLCTSTLRSHRSQEPPGFCSYCAARPQPGLLV